MSAFSNVTIENDNFGGSLLTVHRATAENAGWYQCTAFNCVGTAATQSRVHIDVPPEPIPMPAPRKDLQIPKTGKIIEPEYVFLAMLTHKKAFEMSSIA